MEPRFPLDAYWASWPIEPPVPMLVIHGLLIAALLFQGGGIIWLYRRKVTLDEARSWMLVVNFGMVAAAALISLVFYVESQPGSGVSASGIFLLYLVVYWLLECAVLGLSYGRVFGRRWLILEGLFVGFITLLLTPAVATSVLLPFPGGARESARLSQCKNNLRQLVRAAERVKVTGGGKWLRSQTDEPPMSWRVALLPVLDFVGNGATYSPLHSWDSPENTAFAQQRVPGYRCPSRWHEDADAQKRYYTDYVMVTGAGTIGPANRLVRDFDIKDGTSNTALFSEATGLQIVWTEPRDADVSAASAMTINQPGETKADSPSMLSSHHRNGAFVALADGQVKFVSNKIDPSVIRSLTTIAGGELPVAKLNP